MSTQTKTTVIAYLNFEGRCDEALEFYRRAIGADVNMVMRFKDSPEPPPPGCMPAGSEGKVMHSQFLVGETMVMATDGHCSGKPAFQGISLSLSVLTVAESEKFFKALAEGGQIQMPLAKTFFSPSFGMVMDKFGVVWMVIVHQEMPK